MNRCVRGIKYPPSMVKPSVWVSGSEQDFKIHPNPERTKHPLCRIEFENETTKIVQETYYILLSEEGIPVKELRRGRAPDPVEAHKALHKSCKNVMQFQSKYIRGKIDALKVRSATFGIQYHQIAIRLFEDGSSWSRVVLLVSVSVLLAARLYREGHPGEAKNIGRWLTSFILDLEDWIDKNDGWDGLDVKFKPSKKVGFTDLGQQEVDVSSEKANDQSEETESSWSVDLTRRILLVELAVILSTI